MSTQATAQVVHHWHAQGQAWGSNPLGMVMPRHCTIVWSLLYLSPDINCSCEGGNGDSIFYERLKEEGHYVWLTLTGYTERP